jgi:colanic acid biosynthesis glycosyl transferase WcaI
VLQALDSIRLEKDIYFLIAGSGSRLETCQSLASNLTNPYMHVVFQSPWETKDTSKLLGAADILFLPTLSQQSLASAPSKLITYMLASRPILALALPESNISKIILQVGCGWIVAPDNPRLAVQKIQELVEISREEMDQRGAAGRAYAMNHFVSDVCLRQVLQVVYAAGNTNVGVPLPT